MSWFDRNLPWLLLALVVATTALFVGAVGVGAVVVLQSLLAGVALGALLGDLALVVGVVALLGALDLAFAVALVVTVVRRASFPTDERLAARFDTAEYWLPPLRRLALSDRLSPSLEERKADLEERYVEGDLSEVEFERRLETLLDDEDRGESPRVVAHEVGEDRRFGSGGDEDRGRRDDDRYRIREEE